MSIKDYIFLSNNFPHRLQLINSTSIPMSLKKKKNLVNFTYLESQKRLQLIKPFYSKAAVTQLELDE